MADEHASEDLRMAVLGFIAKGLDSAMSYAKGNFNGYGLSGDDLASLKGTLERVVDSLASMQVKLVRPEVREAIVRELRERETAEKVEAARRDEQYMLGFRYDLFTRPKWKGNKKLRAEVEALYKADPEAG